MPTYNSPGVYTVEKDFSNFAGDSSPTTPGIVGFASQGPVDKPILITSPTELERVFGLPTETTGGQGLLGAYEIMKATNQLVFVRAQTEAANQARANLALGTQPFVIMTSNGPQGVLKPTVATNGYGASGPNLFNPGLTGSTTSGSAHFLVQVSGSNGTATVTKPYFLTVAHCTVDNVVSAFNKCLSDQNDFKVIKIDDSMIAWVGAHPGKNASIHVSGLHPSGQGGAGSTAAVYNPTCDNFRDNELSGHGAIGGGGFLLPKTNTGTYVSFDGDSIGLGPSATGFGWDIGWLAHTGGSNEGKALSGMQPVSGMFFISTGYTSTESNTSLSAISKIGNNGALWAGAANNQSTGGAVFGSGTTLPTNNASAGGYTIRSLHTGRGYNAASSYDGRANVSRGLQVKVENTGIHQQSVQILRGGSVEETYKVDFINEASGIPTMASSVINRNIYGDSETSEYVYGRFENTTTQTPAAVVAPTTRWGATNVDTLNLFAPEDTPVDNMNWVRLLKFFPGIYDLSGGTNGDAGDHGGVMTTGAVKNALAGPAGSLRGVKAFDATQTSVDLIAVPGVHVQDVQAAAIDQAESTGEFLYITSPPEGLSPQDAVEWHNGNYPGRTVSMNSSHAALYYPHCKIFDTFRQIDTLVDPAIFAIKAMCKADRSSDIWVPTAGVTRGKISPTVKELEKDLNQGDRDFIYGGGNAINPIINFPRQGVLLWGQRTTQRTESALDRINVRRLATHIRGRVADIGLPYIFEPNDPITWSMIEGAIAPMLEDIQARRGITSFNVTCDETTNTPLRVERNELWCRIEVVPTKAAESLIFEINVLGQQQA